MRRWLTCLGVGLSLALGCVPPTPAPATPTSSPQATRSEPAARPEGAAAPAPPATHVPTAAPELAPTPTAVALDPIVRTDDTAALASAPEDMAPAARPTAAVLPPSARMVLALTPTPAVLASSPVLAPGAVTIGVAPDYARAIKLVQDVRKDPGSPRLEERIDAAVAQARAAGSEVEVLGWQAALKGSTEVYQVTFALRLNRQGMRAEWEANLHTGEVHATNPLAEALEAQ